MIARAMLAGPAGLHRRPAGAVRAMQFILAMIRDGGVGGGVGGVGLGRVWEGGVGWW